MGFRTVMSTLVEKTSKIYRVKTSRSGCPCAPRTLVILVCPRFPVPSTEGELWRFNCTVSGTNALFGPETCVSMRTAIGLVGLGIFAGVVPAGLAGIAQAGQVLLGTAGALVCLLVCCLAGPIAVRRATPARRPRPAPPRQPSPIVSRQSASRIT